MIGVQRTLRKHVTNCLELGDVSCTLLNHELHDDLSHQVSFGWKLISHKMLLQLSCPI